APGARFGIRANRDRDDDVGKAAGGRAANSPGRVEGNVAAASGEAAAGRSRQPRAGDHQEAGLAGMDLEWLLNGAMKGCTVRRPGEVEGVQSRLQGLDPD